MATTLLQLRTRTLALLNDLSTSQVYQQSTVDQTINDEILGIASKKKWQFLQDIKQFSVGLDTTLSAALGAGDSTATVGSTTNFESSGAVLIERDIVNYTGKTSTTLTGVSNQYMAHAEGVRVDPLYILPTDYLRTPEVLRRAGGAEVSYRIDYVNEFEFEEDMRVSKFTIINDGDTKYLWVVGISSGDTITCMYYKKPTVLSDDADTTEVPDGWAIKVLPKLAAYKLMLMFGDNLEGQAYELKAVADQELAEMYKLFGQREQPFSKRIRSSYQSQINDTYLYHRTRR